MMSVFRKFHLFAIVTSLNALVVFSLVVVAIAEQTNEDTISVLIDGNPASVKRGAIFARRGQDIEIILSDAPATGVQWHLNTAKPLDYNNQLYCKNIRSCTQPIEYTTEEIPSYRDKTRIVLSENPKLTVLGTHELTVRTDHYEKQLQVVIRQDDSFVGYATELLGVPFVYAPGYQAGMHQTDLRKGADCVALILYARRRLGDAVPYVAPPRLYDFTRKIGDKSTVSRARIETGDILHFGFQTAIVAEHRSNKVGLDDNDLIIHTYHGVAEITTFSHLAYKNEHYDILRWK